jgi:hypothetical protein
LLLAPPVRLFLLTLESPLPCFPVLVSNSWIGLKALYSSVVKHQALYSTLINYLNDFGCDIWYWYLTITNLVLIFLHSKHQKIGHSNYQHSSPGSLNSKFAGLCCLHTLCLQWYSLLHEKHLVTVTMSGALKDLMVVTQ